MQKTVLATAAAIAIAGGSLTIQAFAADLEFLPPPPPVVPTWSGFYIGGHVGYGESKFDRDDRVTRTIDPDGTTLSNRFRTTLRPDGLIGGAQAGYNWQHGGLVVGIEGDVSFADWGKSAVVFDTDRGDFGVPFAGRALSTTSADVDLLASVRGRLGLASDSLLIYGTGGVAFADAQVNSRIIVDGDTVVSRSKSFNDVGFVVGGGLGWMVVPQTFSLGVEGLYYVFNDKKTVLDHEFAFEDELVAVRARAKFDDAWVIRVRGDFHF